MNKQRRNLLIVAAVLLIFWYLKNRQPNFRAAYTPSGEGEGEVDTVDDYYYGGGGTGYVAGGSDATDSQNYDPDSNYTEETILNAWGFPGDFKPGGRSPVVSTKPPSTSKPPQEAYTTKTMARILR